jgi:hypothetical protein
LYLRVFSCAMERRRSLYLLAAIVVVALGLASRRYGGVLPPFIAEYAGDTLWALMVFLGICVLFPRAPISKAAVAALLISYGVEFSQLYHAPWIDALRRTTVGRLTLGSGFLWSDLVCYTAGAASGVVLDRALNGRAS